MISIELKQLVDPNNEACCEYHLAHKVKEWAYTTGITNFLSGQADHGRKCEFYEGFDEIVLYANTEPEAIFKAGEWILNQQDKGMG